MQNAVGHTDLTNVVDARREDDEILFRSVHPHFLQNSVGQHSNAPRVPAGPWIPQIHGIRHALQQLARLLTHFHGVFESDVHQGRGKGQQAERPEPLRSRHDAEEANQILGALGKSRLAHHGSDDARGRLTADGSEHQRTGEHVPNPE